MSAAIVYAVDVRALDPDDPAWEGMLSLERRARMRALAHADDRRRALGAELALNAALRARFADYAPPPAYRRLPGGKPVLEAEGAHISLAHAGDWAVCVLCDAPVGVDIERGARRASIPVREWVGVESYLKLTGEGLAGGFRALCAGEAAVYRLGERVAHLARAALEDYIVCVATDTPVEVEIVRVDPAREIRAAGLRPGREGRRSV